MQIRLIGFGVLLAYAACLTQPANAESELADAAEAADQTRFMALLGSVDVNASQPDGMTALHWATFHQQAEWVDHLLQGGADANAATAYGIRPVGIAAQNGDAESLRYLLASGADGDYRYRGRETPLMVAARTGILECVKLLTKHGSDVNAADRSGQTALMWAAAEGHTPVIDFLINNNGDWTLSLRSGFTPYFLAVRGGHISTVQRFLQAGADVNAVMDTRLTGGKRVRDHTSALILAIENGHFELAKVLLEAGADPNDERSGYAPLHVLSWVRKPNSGDGDDGDPPPIGSGSLTSLQIVDLLIDHGADVNQQLKKGRGGRARLHHQLATPFLLAADTADLPLMKALLKHGADVHLANVEGSTPLMAAAGLGTYAPTEEAGTEPESLAAVEFLLTQGADINAVDKRGETAMHSAAYANFPQMVTFLDQSGANIEVWNTQNEYGWTPLVIAQGFRPGNFKPAPSTVAAIEAVMRSYGVSPTPPPPRDPKDDQRYRSQKAKPAP